VNKFGSKERRAKKERPLSQARPYMPGGKPSDGDAI